MNFFVLLFCVNSIFCFSKSNFVSFVIFGECHSGNPFLEFCINQSAALIEWICFPFFKYPRVQNIIHFFLSELAPLTTKLSLVYNFIFSFHRVRENNSVKSLISFDNWAHRSLIQMQFLSNHPVRGSIPFFLQRAHRHEPLFNNFFLGLEIYSFSFSF